MPALPVPGYRWTGGWVADNFAGGGGASTGMAQAIGRSPDFAVNHNKQALKMHEQNHPTTRHFNESVWEVPVRQVTAGVPTLFGWFSPDCTHFSIAKGGAPVKKAIRGLAWIIKKWAGQGDMAVFFMENVPEFVTWGPLIAKRCKDTKRVIKLVPDGLDKHKKPKFKEVVSEPGERVPYREQALIPDKKRAGKTFRQFCKQLGEMGYHFEFNTLVASDFGAPTIRKRFFGIGRKDGLPIIWPKRTHAPLKVARANGLKPQLTAGDHLDWSIPCPSIFAEGRKPLAENTMRRIAKGIQKFVLEAGDDAFLVKVNHGYDQFRGQSLNEPLQTITSKLGTGVVDVELQPLVQAEFITTVDHASTKDPSNGLDSPLSTVTGKARHLRVAAMLKHYTGVTGHTLDRPIGTITATDHHSVLEAALQPVDPVHDLEEAITAAHIQRDFGKSVGQAVGEPIGTITAGGSGKAALIASHLVKLKGTCQHGQSLHEPIGTIQAQGNHYAQVQAFLMKYYTTGAIGQNLNDPLHTITSKTRFAVVTIHGIDYEIVDIGMRMLTPKELYRCQGFPEGYEHEVVMGEKLPGHAQVRMVGNSVPPQLAKALVEANIPKWALERQELMTA